MNGVKVAISLPAPQLQVDFALAREQVRGLYLQEALSKVVVSLDIPTIDVELARFAPPQSLAELAGHGLRGELLFAAPCVLRTSPRLLGYYRLLSGFSQKAFYSAQGVGRFRSMEEAGALRKAQDDALDALCSGLAAASAGLLEGSGRNESAESRWMTLLC